MTTAPLAAFLEPVPLIAVLRGITPEEVPAIAGVLVDAGFRILEVPLNSPRPFESIRILADAFGEVLTRRGHPDAAARGLWRIARRAGLVHS